MSDVNTQEKSRLDWAVRLSDWLCKLIHIHYWVTFATIEISDSGLIGKAKITKVELKYFTICENTNGAAKYYARYLSVDIRKNFGLFHCYSFETQDTV